MRHNANDHGPQIHMPKMDLQAFGLAAVAAELNLRIDTLEHEVAQAIERGAAALYLAGYGPRVVRAGERRRTDANGRRPKTERVETPSGRRATAKVRASIARKRAH